MTPTLKGSLPDSAPALSIVFDTNDTSQCDTLHAMRTVFQARSDIEALSERHFILHIFPGLPRGEAA